CELVMARLTGAGSLFPDTEPPTPGTSSPQPLTVKGEDPEDAVPPEVPGCDLDGTYKRGGMGVVYFGTECELNRPVAVKVLKKRQENQSESIVRFIAEAQI